MKYSNVSREMMKGLLARYFNTVPARVDENAR